MKKRWLSRTFYPRWAGERVVAAIATVSIATVSIATLSITSAAVAGSLSFDSPTVAIGRLPATDVRPTSHRIAQATVTPAVLDRVKADLARRTGQNPKKFKLVSASQQTWPDGCLGLAKPQEACTQALVDGWRIVMVSGKQKWSYRTDSSGRTLRLE